MEEKKRALRPSPYRLPWECKGKRSKEVMASSSLIKLYISFCRAKPGSTSASENKENKDNEARYSVYLTSCFLLSI